jgi:hypothetical protein
LRVIIIYVMTIPTARPHGEKLAVRPPGRIDAPQS